MCPFTLGGCLWNRDSGQHCRGSEDHDTTKYSLSGYWLRPCRSLQDQFTKWLLTILPLPREGVLERVQGPAHPHYMRGLTVAIAAKGSSLLLRQTDRQTDGQTDSQTDRQTD